MCLDKEGNETKIVEYNTELYYDWNELETIDEMCDNEESFLVGKLYY